MKFEILKIESARSVDGVTRIHAVAQDKEETIVSTECFNIEFVGLTQKSIGILLEKKYRDILKSKGTVPRIKVGDIVGGE